MWLFSQHGFFSAVQNYNNPHLIHVRSNFRGDLERLCFAHGIKPQVFVIKGSEYPFRMDFPRDIWGEVIKREGVQINYSKFQASVQDGTKRDKAYSEIASVLHKYQD